MFMLNGKPLALDVPFTIGEGDDAIQYPANWLRLASIEEKAAIGITEVDESPVYDDRFYWGVGNPKDLEQCREMLATSLKQAAYSMLQPTDYKLVRKLETGEDVDQDTLDARAAIRATHAANQALVSAASSVDELAAIKFAWPVSQ